MSGVFGLIRLDGRQATNEGLAPIAEAQAHRGPDGGGTWVQGSVSLGFALLATTPEALGEVLPLTHAASGCTITADARLDNRHELALKMGIDARGKGDGELILLAYLRWGEAAMDHLLGDFAFAIWDEPKRRLLAARDHMGMRQLHYCHRKGHIFAFATDDRGLLAHSEISVGLREVRIADFLADLEATDLTSTFYQGVERLPPAHMLTLDKDTIRVRRYWTLDPREPLILASSGEYADAFLDVFTEAVKARLRSAGTVGAMLSGGLDSSSVVAIAVGLRGGAPFPVFSAVDEAGEEGTETWMIRRVQALGGLAPYEVRPSDHLFAAANLLPAMGRHNPFDGVMSLPASVYQLAQRTGCNVILDGVAGDIVLDHRNWIARLLRGGELGKAWSEAQGEYTFWSAGEKPAQLMADAARAAFLPEWLRTFRRYATLCTGLVLPPAGVMRADFARRVGLARQINDVATKVPRPSQSYPSERVAGILQDSLVVARERYDRVASLFGIEARDPFLDLRLIRFAQALPPEQLVLNGYTKRVLREAMSGVLPHEVCWRRGKEHLGTRFIAEAIKVQQPAWTSVIQAHVPTLKAWIRPSVLKQSVGVVEAQHQPGYRNVGYLAQWLTSKPVALSSKMGK